MEAKNTLSVSVRMDSQMHKTLKEMAREQHRTISAQILFLVERSLGSGGKTCNESAEVRP